MADRFGSVDVTGDLGKSGFSGAVGMNEGPDWGGFERECKVRKWRKWDKNLL